MDSHGDIAMRSSNGIRSDQDSLPFVQDVLQQRYVTLLSKVPNHSLSSLVFDLAQESFVDRDTRYQLLMLAPDSERGLLVLQLSKVLASNGSSSLVSYSRVIQRYFPSKKAGATDGGLVGDEGKTPAIHGTHCTQSKREIKDVPDPPMVVMDSFTVLFKSLITNLLSLPHNSGQHRAGLSGLLIPDVPSDEIDSFFEFEELSTENVVSVFPVSTGNSVSPPPIKLTSLLRSYQQLVAAYKSALSKNHKFEKRAVFIRKLVEQNEMLEGEIKRLTSAIAQLGTAGHEEGGMNGVAAVGWDDGESYSSMAEMMELREKLRASNERNQQLVEVTRQWDLEYRELEMETNELRAQLTEMKTKMDARVADVLKELEETSADRDTYKKKYNRAKKYFSTSGPGGRGNRALEQQLEELRFELHERKESQDLFMAEKDKLVSELREEVRRRVEECEEREQHIVELRDQLDNFRIQAKVKEPSVTELSLLSKEKRELTDKMSYLEQERARMTSKITHLEKQLLEQGDELFAAKLHLNELQKARAPAVKGVPKTQAMVTGYHPRKLISRDVQGPTEQSSNDPSLPSSSPPSPRQVQQNGVPFHNKPSKRDRPSFIPGADSSSKSLVLLNGMGTGDCVIKGADPSVNKPPIPAPRVRHRPHSNPSPPTSPPHPRCTPAPSPTHKPSAVGPSRLPRPRDTPTGSPDSSDVFLSSKRQCPSCQEVFSHFDGPQFSTHIEECFSR